MPSGPSPSTAQLTFFVPFYKGKDYLRRTLASVRKQTRGDWELVVVDDRGPEDGVDQVVAAFQEPRFWYLRNPQNLGLAGNWNRCLDLVSTPFFTLLHADDELLPNYAELMLSAAARFPTAAALYCNANIIDEHSRAHFSFPDFYKRVMTRRDPDGRVLSGEEGLTALLRGNFIMCPTLCYRAERIGSRRFVADRKMVVDLEFTSRLLLEGEQLVGLKEIAYAYRRHGENATAQYTASLLRFEEELQLYRELSDVAQGRSWHQAAVIGQRQRIIKLNLTFCVFKDLLGGHFGAAARKAELLCKVLVRALPAGAT